MYTEKMTREKRETLELAVLKPDLSKCVNTDRNTENMDLLHSFTW